MMEMEEYGNDIATREVGYIIGDAFAELAQLPGVLTVTQFFTAHFAECLPYYRVWIIGQGISSEIRNILNLCNAHSRKIKLQFTENTTPTTQAIELHPFEWDRFQFVDGTRVQASLTLIEVSEAELLSQVLLIQAAKEFNERACKETLPGSKISVKQVNFQRFQQMMPLPLNVETQFELNKNENKRSMKSLTRFYQNEVCIAEVILIFDFYTAEEACKILKNLGYKTFESFSNKIE